MNSSTSLHPVYAEFPFLLTFAQDYEKAWGITGECDFCKNTLPHAVVLCFVYFISCFTGKWLMKTREPFDLKKALALWNLLLAVFSFLGAARTLPYLVTSWYKNGTYYTICTNAQEHYGHGPVGFWSFLFIMSKIPELLDTAFIVLRKKPLIFLHWYHHITVLLFCWHAYATKSASGLYFISMNYTVHAVMYFYYFLTALGYRPKWALFVTLIQLSQMAIGLGVCFMGWYYPNAGRDCRVDAGNVRWGFLMYATYFGLFFKFLIQRYIFQSTRPLKRKQA